MKISHYLWKKEEHALEKIVLDGDFSGKKIENAEEKIKEGVL